MSSGLGSLDERGDLRWFDLRLLPWEGRGWRLEEMEHLGDRLPMRGDVPEEVRKKSHYASGLCVRFHSDTDRVFLRWTDRNGNPPRDKPSHSRPDLYVRMPGTSRWRWAGLCTNLLNYDRAWISDDFAAEPREYLLYMGYLDGLSSMEIGLAPQASLAALPIRTDKPILFYGTSITCGQSVSRAGLTYTAQVGRALDRHIVNLGFPGNGKMELPTVQLIAEVNAAAFVIACVENMDAAQISERTEPLVRCLRAAHPRTPIILVESVLYENAWLVRAHQTRVQTSNDALRGAYERCLAAGVQHVHYVSCDRLLDPDQEGTVDGVHPNDVGSTTIAKTLVEVLRPLMV